MQRGWQKGEIVWNSGFLSIIYLDKKYSAGYNVMVIGHIEKEDLKILYIYKKFYFLTIENIYLS